MSKVLEIPRELIKEGKLIIVPQKEYKAFLDWREKTKDVLVKIARGERELRSGKTRVVSSPRELLK